MASQGVDCAGWLYVSDDLEAGRRAPAIVMANAVSAVREIDGRWQEFDGIGLFTRLGLIPPMGPGGG